MFFRVDSQIFQKVNDYCVGIIAACGLSQTSKPEALRAYCEAAAGDVSAKLQGIDIKTMPTVGRCRSAMSALGINPNKYPSSVEALLRRVQAGNPIESASAAIDLGNAVSIQYGFPVGLHNMDSFAGDMEVRYAKDDDIFDDGTHKDAQNEVVYATGSSVRTRNWLWRQTEAGRAGTATAANLLFLIDGFEEYADDVLKARDALAALLKTHFSCELRVGLVSAKKPSFKIAGLTEMEKSAEDDVKIVLKGAADHTEEGEIYERLLTARQEGRPLRIKLGLDPSAPDIHIGHAVVLRKIRQFQELGHTAVIIFGDFTGMIGDPSGKSKTRNQLSYDEVRTNAKTYQDQIFKIIDPSKTEVHFNSEWLGKMTFTDVINLCGKTTVARILERDDFSSRFKSHTPIGLHEFLYPLMQAYDSVAIEADIEIGGTDQTFNINMGRRIMQLYERESQLTLFMPLLEGTDGVEKMSKSLGNYIGIFEEPHMIYEKVMKIPDSLIIKYYTLCTDVHPDGIALVRESLQKGKNPRDVKMELAFEITSLYCGAEAAKSAQAHFVDLFQKNEAPADTEVLDLSGLEGSIEERIIGALLQTGKFASKSDIRRLIKQGGLRWNGEKTSDLNLSLRDAREGTLRAGKGNVFIVKL